MNNNINEQIVHINCNKTLQKPFIAIDEFLMIRTTIVSERFGNHGNENTDRDQSLITDSVI